MYQDSGIWLPPKDYLMFFPRYRQPLNVPGDFTTDKIWSVESFQEDANIYYLFVLSYIRTRRSHFWPGVPACVSSQFSPPPRYYCGYYNNCLCKDVE